MYLEKKDDIGRVESALTVDMPISRVVTNHGHVDNIPY